MPTPTPQFARTPKAGLQRSPHLFAGSGAGTPAPGAGYALTIAEREVARLAFDHEHDRHDVVVGVAVVAAKRASLIGRGPTVGDVRAALDHFGLLSATSVDHHLASPFAGLAHSYVAQRAFADAVSADDLVGPTDR